VRFHGQHPVAAQPGAVGALFLDPAFYPGAGPENLRADRDPQLPTDRRTLAMPFSAGRDETSMGWDSDLSLRHSWFGRLTWSRSRTPNGVRTRVSTLRERRCSCAEGSLLHLAWSSRQHAPSRPIAFMETGPFYGMTSDAPATT
jgi:hypothetical protein